MLELICHQSYTWNGVPADKSPYRNHGSAFNTDGSFDGSEPGSGVIKFPHPDSRVRIANGPAWEPLIALKIDVLARVDPHARRWSRLVAGHDSFQFGILEGALEAQFNNSTGNDNYVRSADAFAPDHQYHPVPANKWVKLGFHHDGFARMRLFIDDVLVGEAIVEGGIPPVQHLGVSIGNNIDSDDLQFPGEIDELRIWRLDPKAMKREFLGRPYTHDEARCWQQHAEQVIDWMRKNPEQRSALARQIRAAQNSFIRALFLLPESDQAKLRALLSAFANLWFAGKIAGPEMEKVLCDWIALLRSLGLDPSSDPAHQNLTATLEALNSKTHDVLECDPQIAAFLDLLRNAVENCGKTTEAAL
jgi:Concanavalin A-like lectin/glucanases superfamily